MKLSNWCGVAALTLTSTLLTNTVAFANPLAELHGETYRTISSGRFGAITLDLPRGVEDTGGWIIGSAFSNSESWGISIFRQGDIRILSLDLMLSRERHEYYNVPINEQVRMIADSTVVPLRGSTAAECQIDGVYDEEILAIADPESPFEVEWFTEFQGVWRANRKTQQLEEISADNVRCYNTGYMYGYDG